MTTLNYVSAPQANIYFNGILIDECYDIQYSYREAKEPIYGYLSQHFDAVLKGTVLITGALTINYIHDQYLSQVLAKADLTVPSGTTRNSMPSTLKNLQNEYNKALGAYASDVKTVNKINAQIAQLQKEIKSAQSAFDTQQSAREEAVQTAVDEAQSAINEFEGMTPQPLIKNIKDDYALYQSYSASNPEHQRQVERLTAEMESLQNDAKILAESLLSEKTGDPDILAKIQASIDQNNRMIQEEQDQINREQAAIIDLQELADNYEKENPGFQAYLALKDKLDSQNQVKSQFTNAPPDNLDLTKLQNELEIAKKTIAGIDLEEQRQDLNSLKDDLSDFTVTQAELAGAVLLGDKTSQDLNSKRAESLMTDTGFTIEFNYNGAPHKRILGCQLLGHSHVISQSGMPIKENFTFIGKKLE